jgi:pilus assembly protein CpaC
VSLEISMNTSLNSLSRRAIGLLAPALVAILAAGPGLGTAMAQETQLTISPQAYGATRSIDIEVNKSMILDLPAGVAEVVITQPGIAAAIMRTRTRAILQGITGGNTNMFFLDDAGNTIQILDVNITGGSAVGTAIESALARVIPGSNITVESIALNGSDRVVLTGTVLSGEDKQRAEAIAAQFAGSAENVASILDVSGSQQVMLQVTVSEVRREVAKQLGINLSGTVTIGSANFGFNSTQTALTNGVNGTFPIGNASITAAIRALEERDALRVLAQPTLTAMSGESARFLAGGELPTGFFNDEYKPYGVELDFTPTVKSNGVIGLKVDTSVSEPQTDGSLTKRQASTSVELPVGTTLAIGGLLDERTSQAVNQLPGLGNIPILGALFRSREYQTQQTELVILVTPYLVAPSPANAIPVPTDTTTMASDAEAVFLGKLENMYGVGGTAPMRGSISGSVGFVLD